MGKILMPVILATTFMEFLSSCNLSAPGDGGNGDTGGGDTGAGPVTVLGPWTKDEETVFEGILSNFENDSGVQVDYTSSNNIWTDLQTAVQAGTPPDLAGLPSIGLVRQYADSGDLKDLSAVLDMTRIQTDYSQGWIDRGTVNGKLVAIFTKASAKGLIFYNKNEATAAGISQPPTWSDLVTMTDTIYTNTGHPAWSIGVAAGDSSGWPGTDWLENIFLKMWGPDEYHKWATGQLAWTSNEVQQAWTTWGDVVDYTQHPHRTINSNGYMVNTQFQDAADPLFTSPPTAYLHEQASFMEGFIEGNFDTLVPGSDFSVLKFPDINSSYSNSFEVAGDAFVLFDDRTNAGKLIDYLSTADAQVAWLQTGAISPNSSVPRSDYQDKLVRTVAGYLANADIVVFDGSDQMTSRMNQAFFDGVVSYLNDPSQLSSVLSNLESVRQQEYSS